MQQQMVVIRLDSSTLVWLSGMIGGAIAPALHDTLTSLIADQARPLVLDLTDVPAVDEAALSVLAAAGLQAGERGGIELRLPRGRRQLVQDANTMRQAIRAAYPAAA